MSEAKLEPPFPLACRTGRAFISPCCTAGTFEFLVNGTYYLATSVAGHGWFPVRPGRIEDINDTGTLVEAPGRERPVHWRADRETQ